MATGSKQERLIIVTGFGPFAGHEEVNASWEAVKLLPNSIEFNEEKYRLIKEQVPVEYESVDRSVKSIWDLNPELVIHCGVNGSSSCIQVERLAYNNKFKRSDYSGKYLKNGKAFVNNCTSDSDYKIECGFDVQQIVDNVSKKFSCCIDAGNGEETIDKSLEVAKCSNDIGSYLCGYIYLKSLDVDKDRTLFIHVPPIDKPFSSEDTADVILMITRECLSHLMNSMENKRVNEKAVSASV